jgi:hypothetical protein
MNLTIFNFQNMMDMHKGYAYQIFNSIVYGKKITLSITYPPRTKPRWTNPKQSNLLGNWTPILWRTLPNCNTSSLPQPHPTQTHPSPTNLITINLQFFKRVMFVNWIVVLLYQRLLLSSIAWSLNLACNWHTKPIIHQINNLVNVLHLQMTMP